MPAMPSAIVLIVCKSISVPFASELDEHNARWTGYEPRTWAIEESMMQCRRHEIQLYDTQVGPNAAAQPFNQHHCLRAGLTEGIHWDETHQNSKYRFWRAACPVPIVDTRTGKTLSWKMPECPRYSTQDRVAVHCEVDISI